MSVLRVLAIAVALLSTLMVAHAGGQSPPKGFRLVQKAKDGMVFAVPKKGPLRLSHIDYEGAHFTGEVRISGAYVFGHKDSRLRLGDRKETPDLYFVPDEASQALLPYLFAYGPVKGLYFSNGRAFLRAALPAGTADQVIKREIKSVGGKLTIRVDQYLATDECGFPVYTARFLRIETPNDLVARNDLVASISCG